MYLPVYFPVYLPVCFCVLTYLYIFKFYLTLHVYSFCRRKIQTRLPVLFSTLLPNVPRLFCLGHSACHCFFPSIYLAPVPVCSLVFSHRRSVLVSDMLCTRPRLPVLLSDGNLGHILACFASIFFRDLGAARLVNLRTVC